ncbi:hypothetical protein [Actinomycetospora flava]|uniref:Uncharacterized protein n=1 Tax=Actinomycetospora flava TaxID=3129232 RepID=A0ABU8MHG8_9PSEU
MEIRNARARLIAIEAARIDTVLDGLPEHQHPSQVRARLHELMEATADVTLPGWLVARAFGLPIDQRSGAYVLTVDNHLLPLRVHQANAEAAAA